MARLGVGATAPDFSAPADNGDTISLANFRGKWVVLYFYPADNTPGCTAEACSFRDANDEFVDAGAVVVGVSGDSVESHAGFKSKHGLPFPLIADGDGAVRAAFGVGKSLGILPERVTFVIDPDGVIRHVFSSQLRASRHHTEALQAIRSAS